MRFVLRHVTRTLRGPARVFELRVPRFDVEQGEVLALVGESGSGKTAMLELLALAAVPDRGGTFVLEGPEPVDVAALWRERRLAALAATRAKRLGFVAQAGGLLPFLTARANAALAQEVAGRPDTRRIARLAERLGVAAVLDERPARLSFGQRQRAAILRALAHRPDFVIADEPTSALDPGAAEEVMKLFLSTAAEEGAGVIVSSHNVVLMGKVGAEIVKVIPENWREWGTEPGEAAHSEGALGTTSRSPVPVPPEATPGPGDGGSAAAPRPDAVPSPSEARDRWISRVERAP